MEKINQNAIEYANSLFIKESNPECWDLVYNSFLKGAFSDASRNFCIKMIKNEESNQFKESIESHQKQYPNITTGDIQSYAIGWQDCVNSLLK